MKKTLIALMALAGVALGANGDLTKIYDFESLRALGLGQGNISVDTTTYDTTVYDCSQGPYYQGITSEEMGNILTGTTENTCLTIAFWVNHTDDVASYQMLFGWGEAGKGFKFGFDYNDLCSTTKNVANVKAGTMAENSWILIAATYQCEADGQLTIILRNATEGTNSEIWTNSNVSYNAPTDTSKFGLLSGVSGGGTEQYKGLLAGAGVFTSTGNASDVTNSAIKAAMGAAPVLVPEPATATLSLLALAGLAVRRRRK